MIFSQALNKRTFPTWLWVVIFLISISGTAVMGLKPHMIESWWWVLASFNGFFSLISLVYTVINIRKLKKNIEGSVIGSRFVWSFVKLTPIIVIIPVLTFYLFSFQTVRDNVKTSEQAFEKFSNEFIQKVSKLSKENIKVTEARYAGRTVRQLGKLSYEWDKLIDRNLMKTELPPGILPYLEDFVRFDSTCRIALSNNKEELIAQVSNSDCPTISDNLMQNTGQSPYVYKMSEDSNFIRVKISTALAGIKTDSPLIVDIIYIPELSEAKLINTLKVGKINTRFDLNKSVNDQRFLIDFSSTILLAILSIMMIIFRTMDHLVKPLHTLSLATKEIAKGNYNVKVDNNKQNKDMRELIGHFNTMAMQIKSSRAGLDTHNLYLETILKYSYGVMGLDKDRKIQLINPIIGEMLGFGDEDSFIGRFCPEIVEKYPYLKPLFSMTSNRLQQDFGEWSEEIEILLPDRHVLLSCQGAALEVENEILGYVIIVKDISQLNRAQKKAAWGEVAMRMAHEIKNPLTPISLSAERLRNRFLKTLKGEDLEIIDKTTNVIIEQVKSMAAMVSAFSDYANMPQIERKLIDINTLISQSIDLYDAQDNVVIALDLASDTPKLLLDSNNISRVLINLIKNATESVDKKRDLEIEITTQYLSDQSVVRLTIQDNGDGFDGAIIDRVFEPYVTTKVKGSGLGMAIVHNIIEQHDGKIFAKNIEPHGAIITIDFNYK
ncbi:MAG: ATP-binding protein [Candidatus Thioglobus sp.]|nr:ATP-binding protein [Candidatus Thioglobus sp.]